jgi:UDP-glucose 4-epimerase
VVTGGSGFLGSWICRVLTINFDVIALCRPTSNLYRLKDLNQVKVNLIPEIDWVRFLSIQNADALILADWCGVGNEFRNDFSQFHNIARQESLVIAAINSGMKLVVGIGSQAELGQVDSVITEKSPDNPTTRYGEAKVFAHSTFNKKLQNSDVRFAWLRIFSTYGPLDEGSWLIPNMVDSLVNNKGMALTKGEQEWSYLHAYDLAYAFKTTVMNSTISGVVNVGNPQTISIRDAASTIGNILEKEELLEFGALDYRPDQVMRLQPLCETLTKAGWLPQISFEQGIRQTIDWLQRKDLQPIITQSGQSLDFKLPVRP